MDIRNLPIIELKKLAKCRKIKQYYIMKKDDLVELLLMEELPFKYRLEKMTITELRALAKERGMRGFWGLSKEELTRVLFPSTGDDQQKNHGEAGEHEDPQDENANKVGVQTPKDSLEQGADHVAL